MERAIQGTPKLCATVWALPGSTQLDGKQVPCHLGQKTKAPISAVLPKETLYINRGQDIKVTSLEFCLVCTPRYMGGKVSRIDFFFQGPRPLQCPIRLPRKPAAGYLGEKPKEAIQAVPKGWGPWPWQESIDAGESCGRRRNRQKIGNRHRQRHHNNYGLVNESQRWCWQQHDERQYGRCGYHAATDHEIEVDRVFVQPTKAQRLRRSQQQTTEEVGQKKRDRKSIFLFAPETKGGGIDMARARVGRPDYR